MVLQFTGGLFAHLYHHPLLLQWGSPSSKHPPPLGAHLASSPGRFFSMEGRGEKQPGVHCMGDSAHAHLHYPVFG